MIISPTYKASTFLLGADPKLKLDPYMFAFEVNLPFNKYHSYQVFVFTFQVAYPLTFVYL